MDKMVSIPNKEVLNQYMKAMDWKIIMEIWYLLELIMRKIPSSIHASWKSIKNKQEKESSKFQNGGIYCFLFARHGRALTGVSPEHAQIVGSV